jgi:DNA replication protein DnaC
MDNALIMKKLNRLKMPGMAEMLDQRLDQAMKEKWSYSTFVEMLLADEIERRNHKQLTLRLAKSRLDQNKTLETFNFDFNNMIPASLIRELCTCAFIEKKQNIFFLGQSGCGKSHLAHALGHEACRREHDVLSYCTYQLFEWIYAGRGDGTHKRRLAQVIKFPVLILDDYGLQPLNETQQNDLFQLITERYEKNSTIITSNRDIDEWSSVFTNPLLGTAAVDRLVHRGIKISIEGPSYRLEEFKKSCKKEKKNAIVKNKVEII